MNIQLFSDIKSQCLKNLSSPIFKRLTDESDDIIIDLCEQLSLTKKEAMAISQQIGKNIILDSVTLVKECDYISGNNYTLSISGCPMLVEVWQGDAYGEPGNRGLMLLLDDLKKTFSILDDEDSFIEKCKSEIELEG